LTPENEIEAPPQVDVCAENHRLVELALVLLCWNGLLVARKLSQDGLTQAVPPYSMADRETLRLVPTSELLSSALASARMGDDDARWRFVEALHLNGAEEAFTQSAAWCESRVALERCLGADVLGQLGGSGVDTKYAARSVPILCGLVSDSDPSVLNAALVALGHRQFRGSLDSVLSLAGHASADVRIGVVHALCGNETLDAVAALIQLSRDVDSDVRNWATFNLGSQVEVDTPQLRAALLARTKDVHDETRAEALVGLAKRGDRAVLAPLLAELQSDSVGTLAVEAARELGAPELVVAPAGNTTARSASPVSSGARRSRDGLLRTRPRDAAGSAPNLPFATLAG